MKNKQQVADEIVVQYAKVRAATPDDLGEELRKLFGILDEFTQVMQQYNQGRPDIDEMRARAAREFPR